MAASRPLRATVALAALAGAVLGACSDDGDSGAFCDRLADTPDVAEILATIDSGDPGGTEAALREGVRHYRGLEADAPGEVRADIARIRQGVQLVLDAVEEHPDDLPAARQAIAAQSDELAGLAQAGQRVASYASRECDLDLLDPSGETGGYGADVTDVTPTTGG